MTPQVLEIWVYLSASPLLGLTVDAARLPGRVLDLPARAEHPPAAQPGRIVGGHAGAAARRLTDTPYPTYFDGAQFVHFLLGPATVALAVPLYAQLDKLKSALLPLCWPRCSPAR